MGSAPILQGPPGHLPGPRKPAGLGPGRLCVPGPPAHGRGAPGQAAGALGCPRQCFALSPGGGEGNRKPRAENELLRETRQSLLRFSLLARLVQGARPQVAALSFRANTGGPGTLGSWGPLLDLQQPVWLFA